MKDFRWHNKNDINNVEMSVYDKYTDTDVREYGDKVEITESHSEPLMIQINNPSYPPFMTGFIVHYKNEFTFKDGHTETEDRYAYRFYELSETVESEIPFNSEITDKIKWIYLFPDNETKEKIEAMMRGE